MEAGGWRESESLVRLLADLKHAINKASYGAHHLVIRKGVVRDSILLIEMLKAEIEFLQAEKVRLEAHHG